MDYFPVFLNLKAQNCLVIGAGEVAVRKIELLAGSFWSGGNLPFPHC